MSTVYLGGITVGECVPAFGAAIALMLPDLQAKLAALASFSPTPVSFSAQLAVAESVVAGIQASLAVGISPPSIALQIAVVVALIAELEATLGIVAGYTNALGAAGVHLYRYDGAANALGGDFSTALSGGFPGGAPTDFTNALLIATTVPAAWAAIAQLFKVS
jgi:hypothetical protein